MTPRNSPASVLIVEDERIVAKDLQETLSELGYDAFAIASSSDEAVAIATRHRPDIVLMDIRIAGKRDGIETAEILRERLDVPIVYLTAHADEATVARAKATGPKGYLLKPVKSTELRGVIEVALHNAEMERRTRERERWFSTTLRSIKDAVIAVDLSGKVTFMNATAEALTGTTATAAVGQPVADVVRMIEGETTDTPLETALREGRSVVVQEARLVNVATGVERLISDSAALVVDDGQTLGAVMVFRDVTEEKKAQKQLELADRLASLGTMAAGVAHEVNNPLAIVSANSTLLLDDLARHRADLARAGIALDFAAERRVDEMREALGDVVTASERIARIVSDLTAFSRPEGKASGRADAVKAAEWAIRATARELRFRARLVTTFQPVSAVLADEGRLGQVIINLLVNAAHSISPGNADSNEVRVSTRTDDRGFVVIEVRDTGAGMSEEVRTRIFEPFFTTKDPGGGTGLGLSICNGIVASFGGRIEVESSPGAGSTFRVILPAAPDESPRVTTSPAVSTAPVRRRRILAIDDETNMLRLLPRVLADHDLVCTEHASEALELLARGEKFDLILLDVIMPASTGIDFYRQVLQRFPDLAQRIVFLSGGAITPAMRDFLRSVPNRRLGKPFDVAALRTAVREMLAQSDARAVEETVARSADTAPPS